MKEQTTARPHKSSLTNQNFLVTQATDYIFEVLGLQEAILSHLALFQTKFGDELGQFAFQPTCFVPKDRKRAHLELLMLHTP